APKRGLGLIVRLEVLAPDELPLVGVEDTQIAHRSEGIDLAARDGWRAARAGGVAHVVRAVVLVLPNLLAGLCVEAQNSFLSLPFRHNRWVIAALALGRLIVSHVHLALGHGRAG